MHGIGGSEVVSDTTSDVLQVGVRLSKSEASQAPTEEKEEVKIF